MSCGMVPQRLSGRTLRFHAIKWLRIVFEISQEGIDTLLALQGCTESTGVRIDKAVQGFPAIPMREFLAFANLNID